jgi:hypothetical protein
MPGQWMNITAAARRLRVTTKAIRNRIERDSIRWKPNPEREGRLVFVAEREAASDGGAPLRQAPAAAISDGTGAAT